MACLICMGQALASDVLTVSNLTVPQGGEATLAIGAEFETQFKAYQFDIELDDGLILVLDSNGKPVHENGFEGTDHAISCSALSAGKYRFICTSISNSLLPTNGTLLKVKIACEADAEIGSDHTGRITSIELTTTDYQVANLPDLSFTVTIGEPVDTRTLLDELSTTAPEAANSVDVRVRRTINAGEWSTLVLPFAMTAVQVKEAFGSDVLLGDFTGVETEFDDDDNVVAIAVNFAEATAIEENHPYIIKVSEPITEFTVDGVDIVTDEDGACVEFDNGKSGSRRLVYSGFYGTYHAGTVLDDKTLFLSDNMFWYSTGLTKMKAFRAYFEFADVLTAVEEAGSKVNIGFNDKTGIDERLKIKNEKLAPAYNLGGQRVGKDYKGIVVVDGKKVVRK